MGVFECTFTIGDDGLSFGREMIIKWEEQNGEEQNGFTYETAT